MKQSFFTIIAIFLFFTASAQVLSYNKELAHRYEYIEDDDAHFSVLNFNINYDFADSLTQIYNSKTEFLNRNLFDYQINALYINANPILIGDIETNGTEFLPTLGGGLALNATYSEKFQFRTSLFHITSAPGENTKAFCDSFNILPGLGIANPGNSENFNLNNAFFQLIYRPNPVVAFEIGKGKTFFGNGYRSLLLSENTSPYPYFKTTVDIWKVKYVWQAGKLKDYPLYGAGADFQLYDKYAFWHYLSINLTKRINFDFFETIITNPYSHSLEKQGLNISYFNPVIFYRPIEFSEGTLDNALMGIGLNIRLFKSLHLYSQFILDDLLMSTINDGSGWWGNKFGVQAGMKAFNLFNINGLQFIGEINAVRPYTYAHGEISFATMPSQRNMDLNYGAYRQAFAHPDGSNFAEALTHISYAYKRFVVSAFASFSVKGYDTETNVSMGGDIYKSYNLRPDDNGITYLQGNNIQTIKSEIKLNYIVWQKALLELEGGARLEKNNVGLSQKIFFVGLKTALY